MMAAAIIVHPILVLVLWDLAETRSGTSSMDY